MNLNQEMIDHMLYDIRAFRMHVMIFDLSDIIVQEESALKQILK